MISLHCVYDQRTLRAGPMCDCVICVQDLRSMYSRLGIEFDEFSGESEYRADRCRDLLQKLQQAGLLQQAADGRQMLQVDENRRVTLVKSDGSSIYLLRDIAAAVDRYTR